MGNQQPVNGAGGDPTRGGAYGGPYHPQLNPHPHAHQQPHTQSQQQKHQQQQAPVMMMGSGQPPPNFQQRTSSDASMTIMDDTSLAHAVSASQQPPQQQLLSSMQPGGGAAPGVATEDWLEDDTVPTVFRWEHGGRHVYITGTFNGWSRQIPMHRSGNDFTYIHNLKRGKHAFKFIVDDEWRFAPDQPTVADIEGRINNFIDVTAFKPYTGDKDFEKEKAAAEYGLDDQIGTDKEEIFSNSQPDFYDYSKEPPPLPPHLRQIILNKPPHLQDTAALPVPQHVALNHLYCTAIRDNMMVLGITQRYKTKFVTTVYYSPCASN